MMIDHVALHVKDLEGAKDFFEKYFGGKSGNLYPNPSTGFSSYFIRFPDGSSGGTRLEIMNKPELNGDSQAPNRMGFIHLAFSVGSKEQVDTLTGRMKANGWEVISGIVISFVTRIWNFRSMFQEQRQVCNRCACHLAGSCIP